MQLENNTIFITGGGTGIGRGLAEALHQRGNQVIISGRRQQALDETTAANPGMQSIVLDIEDPASLAAAAATLAAKYPKLNVLINNAGIMRLEDLHQPSVETDVLATVTTNLLGPIRMTSALLGHLQQQPAATVINVTSGLAFIPLATTPTYSSTKAGLHSYTLSLRYQLKDTGVKVLELIPPYVQTDLLHGASDPRAMPLAEYIAEVMTLLATDADEIAVQRVLPLRNAAAEGKERGVFTFFNDQMAKGPQ